MADWRDNVISAIRKPETLAEKMGTRNRFLMQTSVPPSFVYLVDKATTELNYARSGWLRRAVAVALSKQLDIPLSEILATTSQVRRKDNRLPLYPDPGYDDLTEIELFCPHPGCDGSHFQ